jgi:hypothetical protein
MANLNEWFVREYLHQYNYLRRDEADGAAIEFLECHPGEDETWFCQIQLNNLRIFDTEFDLYAYAEDGDWTVLVIKH